MRLLWWREAVARLPEDIPAEPLLADIAKALAETGLEGARWGAMAEGWHALLQAPVGDAELNRFAKERGARLFSLSAEILGEPDRDWLDREGEIWALADLATRTSDKALSEKARSLARDKLALAIKRRWPPALRSLGALAALARRDVGRPIARHRQTSPLRIARMVWHRLSGW